MICKFGEDIFVEVVPSRYGGCNALIRSFILNKFPLVFGKVEAVPLL